MKPSFRFLGKRLRPQILRCGELRIMHCRIAYDATLCGTSGHVRERGVILINKTQFNYRILQK